jgi:hypothetical protein
MALNIRPFYGPNFPFNHPLVTYPEQEIPLRAHTNNERDFLKRSLSEEERMKKAVKEIFERLKKVKNFP